MSRPEGSKAPDMFYDADEAFKYNASSRMNNIQREITERAIEMLALPEGKRCYLLDIGCGSGLSGEVLDENNHFWVGCDISADMLALASEKEFDTGDVLASDIGQGLPFRPATFDGVISISAIQWLCYSDSSEQDPKLRLNRFFSSLYSILKRTAKAVLQFYPESPEQAVLIAQAATRVGFAGGVVVDYPNSSKRKKYYLCLSFERTMTMPKALGLHNGSINSTVDVIERIQQNKNGKAQKSSRPKVKSVEWITQKKEKNRKNGKIVKNDSKFTGRKRHDRF